jgi:hypothetical protein
MQNPRTLPPRAAFNVQSPHGESNAGRHTMSRTFIGIVSIVAVSATCGAIQLASGRDLITTGTAGSTISATALEGINRSAKSDRADVVKAPAGPSRTIMVTPEGVTSTSILIRVPTTEARERSSSNARAPASTRKIACEPVVSVLTEVAKLLQPGRCVT